MIGVKRMQNIQNLLERAVKNDIDGDFVECGVWRGGGSIYAKGEKERKR